VLLLLLLLLLSRCGCRGERVHIRADLSIVGICRGERGGSLAREP